MEESISIIIPTLNEEGEIGELLELLQRHRTAAVKEIIVVDGNSNDATVDEAIDGGAWVWMPAEEQHCRASQMNAGARLASGDILWFVHADTRPPATYATDILKAAAKHPFGSFAFQFNSNRLILRITSLFTRLRSMMVRGGDQSLFVTRACWNDVGPFDPEFVVMEEYEWMQRAEKRGYRFHRMKGHMLVSARKHDDRNYFKVQRANLRAFRKFKNGVAPEVIKAEYMRALEDAKR